MSSGGQGWARVGRDEQSGRRCVEMCRGGMNWAGVGGGGQRYAECAEEG
jgi:hypothetical protein